MKFICSDQKLKIGKIYGTNPEIEDISGPDAIYRKAIPFQVLRVASFEEFVTNAIENGADPEFPFDRNKNFYEISMD